MSKKSLTGYIYSAQTCEKIDNVLIKLFDKDRILLEEIHPQNSSWEILEQKKLHEVIFTAPGFCDKKYPINELPEMIRLLEKQIIGYQDKLWFQQEELVHVFVHSTTDYSAEIFRHGLIKQSIEKFSNLAAKTQKVPDSFFVEDGLDWQQSFEYTIPKNSKPGIYSLLLKAEGCEDFAIPFTVSAKKKSEANILVLASTNTWQSYNLWGGRSRYRNFEEQYSEDFISPKRL
ncbi:MAG: hypothetical protein OQL19_03220, partial [Gammaproteobacteria bacterium]|nr:hypothetical protein [Gammaproteobacteria bacterium]